MIIDNAIVIGCLGLGIYILFSMWTTIKQANKLEDKIVNNYKELKGE